MRGGAFESILIPVVRQAVDKDLQAGQQPTPVDDIHIASLDDIRAHALGIDVLELFRDAEKEIDQEGVDQGELLIDLVDEAHLGVHWVLFGEGQ